MRGRLAPGAAQCSWGVGSAARAVAVVVRAGRMVNEGVAIGVAIIARVCAAVCFTTQIAVITTASTVTVASFPVELVGVRRSRVMKRRNPVRLRCGVIK